MQRVPAKQKIGDAAVAAKTGKTWSEWFRILDAAGARKMQHREIAELLDTKHRVPGWWAQMVTVGYEQARGRRQKHERPTGFEISASKTLGAPASAAFKAWQDEATRKRWLPESPLVIRKATANKSMRITWADGKSSLSVNLYRKGAAKCQVVVQHGKLPDAKTAARMKSFWTQRLEELSGLMRG